MNRLNAWMVVFVAVVGFALVYLIALRLMGRRRS